MKRKRKNRGGHHTRDPAVAVTLDSGSHINARAQRTRGEQREPAARWSGEFDACVMRSLISSPLRYSRTSSARARTEGAMVTPSAFAVFMLITSSKVVACSTGRSAGRAPRKILSTNTAPR